MATHINIKQGYDQRLKARIDEEATRKGILSREAHHWPLESLEFAYAVACLDIVLRRSGKARHIYNDIVRAWDLPGCHVFIDACKDVPATKEWMSKTLEAWRKGGPSPDWPEEWFDIYFTHAPAYYEGEPHNTDWEYFLNKLKELILVGFNRQIDQDNETWKVTQYTSIWLVTIIILRLQTEYNKEKLENLHKYCKINVNGNLYDLNAIVTEKPTAGIQRKLYRGLTKVVKDYGFTLKHDTKLLKDAVQWYKCRVNPGSIEAYRDELAENNKYIERSNIEAAIAPYDGATGYPRQWRK